MADSIGKNRRVLVVDDEESFGSLLRQLLVDQGFAVESASGVAEARELCARKHFELVLIDKNLPDGSGLDLAKDLAHTPDDPMLVMMTAYANIDSAVEAMRCGVADYLVKPIDIGELLARLNRVCALQDLKRQNRQLFSELQQKNEALQRDPLTQLYNHAYFQDALQREVLRSRRHDLEFTLLFVDIDRFKTINDSLGHLTGDRVLLELAEILRAVIAGEESPFRMRDTDIAARYGGDEFALILPQTPKAGGAVKAEALRSFVGNHDFATRDLPRITLSIGVSAFPEDGRDPVELIRAADVALYAAKRGGRNLMITYSRTLAGKGGPAFQEAEAEAARLAGLERTISNRAFDFAYQPIVDVSRSAIVAYEALCRPTDGAFSGPEELMATAERAGKVCVLGRVLRERCLEVAAPLLRSGDLFINLHPHELNDPQLLEIEPTWRPFVPRVVFEITETGAIRDYTRTREAIHRLREQGFRIALDDLGAGYSGLNCLSHLEPDFVKLGIGMVRAVHASGRATRLVKHLLEFAAGEGMQIIAEGVESEEQLTLFRDLGVTLMQGYLFAAPQARVNESPLLLPPLPPTGP